ncbi:MAG: hypothetical protein ABJA74_09145 [Lapillicoccus sp.]
MRMSIRGRRSDDLPEDVVVALRGAEGGKVLSAAPGADSRAWLVASAYRVALVDPGRPSGEALVWSRPWHEVDAGSWSGELSTLTLTWADRTRPAQWRLGDGMRERVFLQTLRERVQASVVLGEDLPLRGRRTGRAVIRQDLQTGELLEQVVLGRGVREDEEVAAASARTLAWLREQVGGPQP